MDISQSFLQYIKKHLLFSVKDRLILAVSGGVDSVVLCDLCHRNGFDFVIAHVNYRLRGEESDGDEIFVRQLAAKYGVPCFVQSFDTKQTASEMKKGIQETARDLRYKWFFQLWQELCQHEASEPGSPERSSPGWHAGPGEKRYYLVTAHHADDQVETLLMNFFKGTGINGITAIAPKSVHWLPLRRPLLGMRKTDILAYAKDNGLIYREDSSNLQNDYTRNYLRNELIPSIRKVFPEVESNLLDNIDRFRDVKLIYDHVIEQYRDNLLEKKGATWRIPVRKLLKMPAPATVLYELLKSFGCSPGQAGEASRLLEAGSGRYIATDNYRIFRNRDWLLITPLASHIASDILITESDHELTFPGGKVRFGKMPAGTPIDASPLLAMLDAGKIVYPLLLRKWKQGDYFYPLGMRKKKKISRFLIDRKVPVPEKENIWVIESAKKIIWVVGMRIDDRFKINPSAGEILRIDFVPGKSA